MYFNALALFFSIFIFIFEFDLMTVKIMNVVEGPSNLIFSDLMMMMMEVLTKMIKMMMVIMKMLMTMTKTIMRKVCRANIAW